MNLGMEGWAQGHDAEKRKRKKQRRRKREYVLIVSLFSKISVP